MKPGGSAKRGATRALPPEQSRAASAAIRELRGSRRWSQKDLAEAAGVVQSTVSFAETLRRPLTRDVAAALAAPLGTDLAGLLAGGAR